MSEVNFSIESGEPGLQYEKPNILRIPANQLGEDGEYRCVGNEMQIQTEGQWVNIIQLKEDSGGTEEPSQDALGLRESILTLVLEIDPRHILKFLTNCLVDKIDGYIVLRGVYNWQKAAESLGTVNIGLNIGYGENEPATIFEFFLDNKKRVEYMRKVVQDDDGKDNPADALNFHYCDPE